MNTLFMHFHIRGAVVDISETTADEPPSPDAGFVEVGGELVRVVIAPSAYPPSPQLLAVGRPIHLAGKLYLDTNGRTCCYVARQVTLVGPYH